MVENPNDQILNLEFLSAGLASVQVVEKDSQRLIVQCVIKKAGIMPEISLQVIYKSSKAETVLIRVLI